MAWSVSRGGNTYTFEFEAGPEGESPDWEPSVRRTITPRQGTDYQTYHRLGMDWALRGKGLLSPSQATDYAGLRNAVGYEVTLSDGTDSWTTTLDSCKLRPLVSGVGGYEGELAFSGRR